MIQKSVFRRERSHAGLWVVFVRVECCEKSLKSTQHTATLTHSHPTEPHRVRSSFRVSMLLTLLSLESDFHTKPACMLCHGPQPFTHT